MADDQEEKIKKIFSKAGFKIKDVITLVSPNAKQTYYNKIRRIPLEEDFISLIKSKTGIDLSQFGVKENPMDLDDIIELRRQIHTLKDEQNTLLAKLVALHEENAALKEVIREKDEQLKKTRKAS